mgnify:CR=1 FL=1
MRIKYIIAFIFLGSFYSARSQTAEILGKVESSNNLENIHVINKTSQKFTITNTRGEFKISAKINDTLVVSSIQNKLVTLVIDIEHVLSKRITIALEEQVNELDEVVVEWDERACLGVVMAANGYPEKYAKDEKIELPSDLVDTKIFHAGTKLDNNIIYSNGGRVLCATALGKDIQQAQTKAYKFLEKVDWQGAYYRTDIGFKAI